VDAYRSCGSKLTLLLNNVIAPCPMLYNLFGAKLGVRYGEHSRRISPNSVGYNNSATQRRKTRIHGQRSCRTDREKGALLQLA